MSTDDAVSQHWSYLVGLYVPTAPFALSLQGTQVRGVLVAAVSWRSRRRRRRLPGRVEHSRQQAQSVPRTNTLQQQQKYNTITTCLLYTSRCV